MNLDIETIHACPLCKSKNISPWIVDARDILHQVSEEKFSYSICRSCELVFCAHRPTEQAINEFYPNDYDPYTGIKTEAIGSLATKPNFFIRKLKKLLFKPGKLNALKTIDGMYKRQNGVLLDFGCGSAKFLDIAKVYGWKTIGVDFNQQAIDSVIDAGHEGFLYTANSKLSDIPDESVDFIRLNHVIEHLYCPEDTLLLLRSKLKKNGFFHIATPNPFGISAKKYKQFWRGLECPRHVMLYSPATLKRFLADKLSLKEIVIYHESTCKDYVRSQGNYRKLEKGELIDDVEALIHDKRLMDQYSFLTYFSMLFRRGDRIHAVARK